MIVVFVFITFAISSLARLNSRRKHFMAKLQHIITLSANHREDDAISSVMDSRQTVCYSSFCITGD